MSGAPSPLKIQALLAEYATLRSEIIARSGHGYPMIGLCVTAAAIIVTSNKLWYGIVFYTVLVFVIASIMMWKSWNDIKRCAARVREIELEINELAFEDVLIWENLSGEAETGLLKGKTLCRNVLGAKRPPSRTFRGKIISDDVGSALLETQNPL